MLTALRNQASSWLVKALLILLVASFAIWGIGDIFYGNPEEATVAHVGDSEISSGELNNAFNRSLDNLQRQFGGQLDREQAIGIGLLQQTLDQQISERLLDVETRAMGLTVDDETLRQEITGNPAFQSAGVFDRFRFDQLIRTTGLSEEGFLEVYRQEIARNALTSAVASGAATPDVMADRIYRFRNEERRGRFFKIADAEMTDIGAPDDAAIQEIYEQDEARFTAPDYRKITYITLEPADMLDEIEIPTDAVQAAYDDRAGRYVVEETRSVEQLLAQDEEVANRAKALVEEGKTLTEAAEELSDDGVSLTDLGTVTEGGMAAGLGKDAFAVNEGEVAGPVQSPFGYHLFKINSVEPEQVTSFEEVEDALREELALIEAEDRLPDFATQLDDELAAGGTVAEAADALGLEAKVIEAVDNSGRGQDDAAIDALSAWPLLVRTAFDSPLGEPSLLEETDDGRYYVVQVDEIIESRLKDLDEVRGEVVEVWEERQRRESAKTRAEQLLTRLQETASLDMLADNEGITIETIEPLRRADDGAAIGLNRAAIQALFETEGNDLAAEVIEADDGVLVIAVDEIIEKLPSDDQDGYEQMKLELQRQAQADLLEQFNMALRTRYDVEIDNDVLTQLMEYDPTLGYGGGGPMQQQPFF